MSFLDDIKKQPRGVRETMFVLCVVITISLAGMIWFRSFERNLFTMLNPDEEIQQKYFAQTGNESLFSNIGESFSDLKASISNILNIGKDNSIDTTGTGADIEEQQNRVYIFPLSGGK